MVYSACFSGSRRHFDHFMFFPLFMCKLFFDFVYRIVKVLPLAGGKLLLAFCDHGMKFLNSVRYQSVFFFHGVSFFSGQ